MPRTYALGACFVIIGAVAVACSSSNGDTSPPATPVLEAGAPGETGADPDAGKQSTDITFDSSVSFGKRDCTLTVRFAGTANDVKLAGEFTSWATSPMPMTKTASGYELTLQPGASLVGGQLYAYKLITDGNWILDPTNQYRKIVDGQMNSALKLPACDAGPEIISDKVAVTRSGDTGDMNVRVTLHSASDGEPPVSMTASIDGAKIPVGSWKIDPTAGAVDFTLPGLVKGKHRLSLSATDTKKRDAELVDLPFWVEDEDFDYRDGLLYMFMVDRFANGDTTNDKAIGSPVDYDADWHGGDLEGALKVMQSGYFEKLGVRTVWISPANEQTTKYQVGDGNQQYSAYHGYWPVKARDIEPRFGGGTALQAFVTEAHKRGLRVLLDLINNQVHDDHEYVTPHPDWFRKECQCGDDADGCGWSQRPIDCYFEPYLPDINWQIPGAEQQFIADAVNWIDQYDLDGFRVDAVKHVEANAVYNMRAALARRFEQGGNRVFMVGEIAVGEGDSGTFFGETFANGYEWLDAYTGDEALDGAFDFPLLNNMSGGFTSGTMSLDQVEGYLWKAEHTYDATHQHHVRFLNGHDNPRMASVAAQDPKLGCTWSSGCRGDQLPPVSYTDPAVYTKLKQDLTLVYSMPGVPYLYSGDEVAFPGGADPDMRRNMLFAEPELQSLEMAPPGGTPAVLTQQQIDLRDWARSLGATRAASRALRRGTRTSLLGTDANLWIYAYTTGVAKEYAIVVINRGGDTTRTVSASSIALGASGITAWTPSTGTGTATNTGDSLTITIAAGQAAIFLPK